MLVLGVDMGGSATRWVARRAADGVEVARGETDGATGLLFTQAARDAFHRALAPIPAALPGAVTAACLGVTGAGLARDPAVVAAIGAALSLPPQRIQVLNDMALAWHAVFPQGGGHLVAAGTGSVGLSIDAAGAVTLVGGRGTLIDDGGSAAWIALRALDGLFRRIDETGRPDGVEVLARHFWDAVGGSGWEPVRRHVYGLDRGAIGTLAPAVAAAATQGDPLALSLMTRAGVELARLARVLVARCGLAPVGVIGGVLRLHPAIAMAMQDAVPDIPLHFPAVDAAAHAATMARIGQGAPA
ncbi:MAG TPA: BadF/BadG/BcrA/BcrD ATPase family protein [Pararhodobacter sp.]|uniref:N-acetylglucosamine kinase n=1 Tax=Pararhodobacter sp. TaxID=2127056 RepID=UPI002B80F493|nr:BadF/BadG/BcrA/BcrD ATPase family protein [Pararhodobacter sp.]HPD91140.1 BadF/BadG/BcrA/BcrD ATPase family protein [Pararhodobacter sp.]